MTGRGRGGIINRRTRGGGSGGGGAGRREKAPMGLFLKGDAPSGNGRRIHLSSRNALDRSNTQPPRGDRGPQRPIYRDHRRPRHSGPTNTTKLMISNYPEGTRGDELLAFLKENCKTPDFPHVDWTFTERHAILEVDSKDLFFNVKHLNGINFGHSKLNIRAYNESHRPGESSIELRPNQKDKLLQHLTRSYNPDHKFLNMEALCQLVPDLPPTGFNNRALVKDICNFIQSDFSEVITISLSSNQIETLSAFKDLHKAAPKLLNLSLASNSISTLKELSNLSGYRHQLKELILSDNPASQGLDSGLYHHEIRTIFPALNVLDRVPIQRFIIPFFVPPSLSNFRLPPAADSFFQDPQIQHSCLTFLTQFYRCYDSKRDDLLDCYSNQSMFSLTVCPREADTLVKDTSKHEHFSRNLLELAPTHTNRQKLVTTGKMDIILQLKKMPKTQHQSQLVTDAFVIRLRGSELLQMSVSGTFTEQGSNASRSLTRSFSRSFLLAPPTHPQWPYTILHDQLSVGPVISVETPEAMGEDRSSSASSSSSSSSSFSFTPSSPVLAGDLTAQQQQMVFMLASQASK
eukprot:TRINITY_DN732_c0_g1_i2.p1 TRINITY_DN732_c0_g1~~TRINITY_DN732_c0_g1_i2.p1  ORF type:complete len:575 (+),score=115.15 TRINITY_DN732_c0_g1_i2:58-1782(+)